MAHTTLYSVFLGENYIYGSQGRNQILFYFTIIKKIMFENWTFFTLINKLILVGRLGAFLELYLSLYNSWLQSNSQSQNKAKRLHRNATKCYSTAGDLRVVNRSVSLLFCYLSLLHPLLCKNIDN